MDKKLKILMVTEGFYPDSIGGAHTYVYSLSKKLAKDGHDVYVMTIKTDKATPLQENVEGIKVYRYKTALFGPLLFILRPITSIMNSWIVFRSLIRNVEFDIINFHHPLPAFGISRSSSSKDIQKIYTFHSSISEDVRVQIKKRKYFPHILDTLAISSIKWIEKDILKRCRKIVVLSMFSRRCLTGLYGQNQEKIVLIPGGVDVDMFVPCRDKREKRAELSLPEEKIIFLTARRLVARMGLENLIYAVKYIAEKEKNILLLILGDGFLRGRLQNLIESEGLKDRVILKGAVETSKMPDYYQACDAFIIPSEQDEWFGLVTIEALSCGIPVFGTPVGGTSEILENIDKSMLFSGTGAQDMAKGILKFFENKDYFSGKSQELRKYVVENYSWETVSEKTEKIYYSSLKNK